MKKYAQALMLVGSLFLFSNSQANETITLTTGVDSATMLVYPGTDGDFPLFTAADFTAADTGPSAVELTAASIRTPAGNLGGPWIASLPINPAAKWVSNSDARGTQTTVLYAFPFTITETDINAAVITVYYSVDDRFGDRLDATNDGPNGAVYINGTDIGADEGGNFLTHYQTARINITNLVNTGANTLYLYQMDAGSSSGLMAHAVIQVINTPKAVPVLNVWGLLLLASMLGLFGVVRTRQRA